MSERHQGPGYVDFFVLTSLQSFFSYRPRPYHFASRRSKAVGASAGEL